MRKGIIPGKAMFFLFLAGCTREPPPKGERPDTGVDTTGTAAESDEDSSAETAAPVETADSAEVDSASMDTGETADPQPLCTTFSPTPPRWALGVDRAAEVRVTLDPDVDPATLHDGSLIVMGEVSGYLSGTVTWDGGDAVFTPDRRARAGERVTAVLTGEVACVHGGSPGPRVWTWTAAVDGGTAVFSSTPEVTTGAYTYAVAAHDLNGDGDLELLSVEVHDGTLTVLDGAPGSYAVSQVVAVGTYPDALAGGDLDRDGDVDVVVGAVEGLEVLTNEGGSLLDPEPAGGEAIVTGVRLGDLDGDGDLDAVASSTRGGIGAVTRFENDGAGALSEVQSFLNKDNSEPFPLDLADLDGDDDLDAVVAEHGHANVLFYFNDGTGTLAETQMRVDFWGKAVYANDLDADGDADVAVAHLYDGSLRILRGAGDGSFTVEDELPLTTSHGLCGGDLDADGDIDVAVPQWSEQIVAVGLNDGTGTFTTSTVGTTSEPAAGVYCADLDDDGALDIAVAEAGYSGPSRVTVLLNSP